MWKFAATRIGMAIPTLVIVALAVFILVRLIPGDPAALMLGDSADAASLAALREQLGLNASLPTQFLVWSGHVLQGDLGQSISNRQPVAALIWQRFAVSAQIVLPAVLLATLVAVPLGMLAAWRQGRLTDLALVATATLLLSLPAFWTLEVLNLDYITHARAKGLSEMTVMLRHAFKSSFGPTWTLLGLILGNLLAGVAVIETVFTIPGLGRLLVDAIFARDYPLIQGCLLFIASIYVLVNLFVDLLYPIFDPRVAAS